VDLGRDMESVAGVLSEFGLCLRVIQSSGSVTSSRAVTNRLSSRERDIPACST
jgi:hypothetical protein